MSEPAATMSSAVATPHSLFDTLPSDIAGMVRDEANLTMARQAIERELSVASLTLAQARKRSPLTRYVTSHDFRQERRDRISKLNLRIREMDTLLGRVRRIRERLGGPLRTSLAQHLGNIDTTYRQGLKATRYHEYWRRYHTVIEERTRGFQNELRALRSSLIDDANNHRPRLSGQTLWRISNAHTTASELERAIADLNHVCDLHAAALVNTPFTEVRLPRLEPWSCIAPLYNIASRSIEQALGQVQKLIDDFGDDKAAMLTTIDTLFRDAANLHSSVAETRLMTSWGELQAFAESYLVSDQEIEPLVAQIEARQIESERARVMRQLAPARAN